MSTVEWHAWGTEAFMRAHTTKRPVLLSIVARWSAACRVMDAHVFSDPRVVALIRERVVPIRVDADRRPDIADRYGAGGWPTTMLLTADGDPICGGTYVEAERLASTIAEVADRCANDPATIRALAIEARRARLIAPASAIASDVDGADAAHASRDADEALTWIATRIHDAYDPVHAGFGRDGKFPLAAPVAFALHYGHRIDDDTLLSIATSTLDAMASGGLSDERGAFHRACAHADWSDPDRAHLVDLQADMLRLYLDAYAITGVDRYRDRARGVWAYVDRVLLDREHGGFFTSELEGDVHRILLTDANAKMIRALLQASIAFDEASLAECAARAAERLLPAVYERAAGVAHVLVDTRAQVRGLLGDQVLTSAALLDLADATGDRVYLDLADELMRSCLRKLWDGGAFIDRLRSSAGAGDVGLLADSLHPFALNAEAARVLDRLGHETGHPDFTARAADVRAWMGSVYQQHDVLAADYGLLLLSPNPSS